MLRRSSVALLLVPALLSVPAAPSRGDDKPAKTVEVKVKDVTLKIPETWEQQEPSNKLRLAQFSIPKADGDTAATELVISSFGGGGGNIEQNLPRWTGEFLPEGRSVKLWQGKSSQGEYTLADLKGTHVGSTFAKRPKPLENARMISLVLNIEGKGLYYFKLTGPEKSVAAQADAIRTAIGASTKAEKEYKLDKGE